MKCIKTFRSTKEWRSLDAIFSNKCAILPRKSESPLATNMCAFVLLVTTILFALPFISACCLWKFCFFRLMHCFAFNLPLVHEKWWCQPSAAASIIITKQGAHRFGARHAWSDCRWVSLHKVHGIFHGQLGVCFKDFRFGRL